MAQLISHFETDLDTPLEYALQKKYPGFSSFRILKQSIDARKGQPKFIYRLELFFPGEPMAGTKIEVEKLKKAQCIPEALIVGTGPAGLFAALRLVERGFRCKIFERGSTTTKRMMGISQYWRYGKLNSENNVCFGEGGAGLYSDGKLITRIKSPYISYVLDRLVQFGAPDEIRYSANPHVGSDKIRKLIVPMREYLQQNGCEFYFDTRVTNLIVKDDKCIGLVTAHGQQFFSHSIVLATGHSADDIYDGLYKAGVSLEGKSFAVGFRVEHPQRLINKIQYRSQAEHPALGAAAYRLAHHDSQKNVGVYSFCMCPGGYVIASSTDAQGVVSNGMSNYARNSPYANSAVVVSVDHQEHFGRDLFGGLRFIRDIEQKAYTAVRLAGGHQHLPSQKLVDFLKSKKSSELLKGSSPSHAVSVSLHELLPKTLSDRLVESFEFFDSRRMKGFISKEAQLYGVETRTSAPLRIPRDKDSLESISHSGLYPTGEGAGYAGGITSAAVDGVRVAEAICSKMNLAA